MQLRLPWTRTPAEAPRPARSLAIEGEAVPVEVVRHRRARRYVVRVGDDGGVRLTVPRGASIAGGLRFAERQTPWIERERRRQRERARPWSAGTELWFRGARLALGLDVRGDAVTFGDETVHLSGWIGAARPAGWIRSAVEARLRAIAIEELANRCLDLAAGCGVLATAVRVRDQRSRWGACSAKGTITLNWRLVQMPASVSDYVIFHELMHLKQPNHSRRFWREVERVCPWWRDAERWLRRHGKDIL